MTQTLTTEAMQEIYEAAVHSWASGSQEAEFELLCKLEDVGGTGATIRKLIDMVRAANREAQPVADGENCWSCGKFFTYSQHSECDGYCPHCNAPVDLDEGELSDED